MCESQLVLIYEKSHFLTGDVPLVWERFLNVQIRSDADKVLDSIGNGEQAINTMLDIVCNLNYELFIYSTPDYVLRASRYFLVNEDRYILGVINYKLDNGFMRPVVIDKFRECHVSDFGKYLKEKVGSQFYVEIPGSTKRVLVSVP